MTLRSSTIQTRSGLRSLSAIGWLLALLALSACSSQFEARQRAHALERQRTDSLRMSQAQMVQAAAVSYEQLRQAAQDRGELNRDPAALLRLRRIVDRLAAASAGYRADAPSLGWTVNLIQSDEVDAWCMPGGLIMVYSGLLSNTDLSDDELANLLAHDMAHALLEHARERVSGRFEPGLLEGMGRPDAAASQHVYEIVVGVVGVRAHETEADRLGLELTARAGYDPRAAVSMFFKLDQARVTGTAEWTRRHPMAPGRVAFLTAQADRVLPLYEQARTVFEKP